MNEGTLPLRCVRQAVDCITLCHGTKYITMTMHFFRQPFLEFHVTPDEADVFAEDLKRRAQDIRQKELEK